MCESDADSKTEWRMGMAELYPQRLLCSAFNPCEHGSQSSDDK